MKKIISLFFIFTALFAIVGCQSDEPTPQPSPNPNPTPDPILTLTSSSVVDINGDGGRITITYTLENKQEDIELEVYASAEWINIAGQDTEGEIYADIAPNSSDARSGEIHIGYGKDSAVITVNQAGSTISTFYAQDVHGYYYGEYYSKGMGNYFMNVSDHGFDEYGEALPNSHYYRFDAYAPLYEGDKSGKIPVAEGIYRYDPDNTYAEYTFSAEYSYYWTTDENGYNLPSHQITEGTLTISSEGLTAELLIDGEIHRIEYTGKVELINDEREWTEDVSGPATTLTTDYTPTLDNHYYYKEEYGDYYGVGTNNRVISIFPYDAGGDIVSFEIFSDFTTESLTGTYTGAYTGSANTFLPGAISAGKLTGSGYISYDGQSYATFASGEVTFTENSDGTLTIVYEAQDIYGNTISGSWQGQEDTIPTLAQCPATYHRFSAHKR